MARLSAEIVIERDGQAVKTVPVGGGIMVGRGGDNDLIFADRSISSRHALFYLAGNGHELRVRDLGSANGTWLGAERVSPEAVLADQALVRLGATVTLRVHLREVEASAPLSFERPAFLEDLTAGVRYPISVDEPILVGSGPECVIHFDAATAVAACLTVYDGGEIRLARGDDEAALEVGQVFELGDRQFVFRPESVSGDSTFQISVAPSPTEVALEVDLTRAGGGVARFTVGQNPRVVEVTSENRVALLYVLARAILEDRARGTTPDETGWCGDAAVMQGIWGRQWENQEWNTFQVLLFRLRKELKTAGLDGWLVEKRKGHTRLRVGKVTILQT